jgi:hypothetical protein
MTSIHSPLEMDTYSDADWGGDVHDRYSVHGFVIRLQGCPISWTSKKQKFVALSTTESEYVGLSESLRENIWIRHFLLELMVNVGTPIIKGDNAASLMVASTKSMDTKIKSIDIKYHFIKDHITVKKDFILQKVHTDDNMADILTKALDRGKNNKFTLMVLNISEEKEENKNGIE